jgi:hypothetical protein
MGPASHGTNSDPNGVFGLDPVNARDVAQVRSVYASVYCEWLPPANRRAGETGQRLPAEVAPIAVLLGRTDRLEVPRDGEGIYPVPSVCASVRLPVQA